MLLQHFQQLIFISRNDNKFTQHQPSTPQEISISRQASDYLSVITISFDISLFSLEGVFTNLTTSCFNRQSQWTGSGAWTICSRSLDLHE